MGMPKISDHLLGEMTRDNNLHVARASVFMGATPKEAEFAQIRAVGIQERGKVPLLEVKNVEGNHEAPAATPHGKSPKAPDIER